MAIIAKGHHHTASSTSRSKTSLSNIRLILLLLTSFLFGIAICSALFLWQAHLTDPSLTTLHHVNHIPINANINANDNANGISQPLPPKGGVRYHSLENQDASDSSSSSSSSILDGLKVLVTIASYDFMQLPHLEEVLDGFQDLCYAGSMVDVVVHTTVIYPVAVIDMLNDRMRCNNPSPKAGLTMTFILKPSSVRLHLVDFHRTMFYDRIDQYDLFVYTEDDIRITPTTIAAYLHETNRVQSLLGPVRSTDFNVGIVRYEYDFPENVVITDKTRHATENVTRVYWEHLGKPIFEKAVKRVHDPTLAPYYVSMNLHHQGMYLATPYQLKAWKDRKNCEFDRVRDRPSAKNNPSQPSEGTQRVWMSSQMLYGSKHCAVTQLLPVENFGQLTVLHLPNKNYRRVGKQGRLGGSDNAPKNEFSDGTEVFVPTHPDLLRALELHVEMKRQFPNLREANVGGEGGEKRYTGIRVVDTDIRLGQFHKNHRNVAERRLEEYRAYVQRGGYMIDSDMVIDIDGWRLAS
mmetsp:Transcript_3834/g.7973  ORF Transcript_3834/g.7973 Transcript_3834/m.7973 type:complete len:520 (+) Transcript_3834:83-1642(+)